MTQQRSESAVPSVHSVWRTALAAVAMAVALGGCSSPSSAARSSDPATPQQGASGATVFGDIDVGITRERTR